MAAPFYCPNCAAKLRGMHVLERHLAQKIACRHNAHLTLRRRRARSPSPIPRGRNRHDSLAGPPGSSEVAAPPLHAGHPEVQPTNTSQDNSRDSSTRTYPFKRAGEVLWSGQPTPYEAHKSARENAGLPLHAPFASLGEWELTQILIESGISQRSTDRLLKSDMFSRCRTAAPADYSSFSSNRTYLETIDSLPGPATPWRLIEVTVTGNLRDAKGQIMTEVVDCWARDPVEVVAELLRNPTFKESQTYAPFIEHIEELAERLEDADEEERERIFEDFANTEWWARIQGELADNDHPDATVVPVILASDKTQLSTLSGDKQAWPIYLTIGNIAKDVRKRPSERAVVLLGYLPVTKLECFRESDRSVQGQRLFHFVMRQLLDPLVRAGNEGVLMNCADGGVRRVFPILAAYIADHPEQCLVCCTKENRCPTCPVPRDERGELLDTCYRDHDTALAAMQDPKSDAFETLGMRDVPEPFWEHLPYVNIFGCIVPDLLHQLHKGVFKNHLVKWVSRGREEEVDARFARVPPYQNLRVFNKGISKITQWTGNEYRQMEKVFVGIVDGLHEDARVMICTRAIMDFIYLAHYPSHTLATLEQMHNAIRRFHDHKAVFQDLGAREHFNIPKLHWATNHYVASIIDFGGCDGVSTEISERLHIDFAKLAYRASNRRDYIKQMIVWLTRRERVRWFQGFLRWCDHSARTSSFSEPRQTFYADERSLPPHSREYFEEDPIASEDAPALDYTLSASLTSRILTMNSRGGLHADSHPVNDDAMDIDEPQTYLDHAMDVDRAGLRDEQMDTDDDALDMPFGSYRIARHPGFGYQTGRDISANMNAVAFTSALARFLQGEGISVAPSRLLDHQFPVYKRLSRVLPSLRGRDNDSFSDTVFAIPADGENATKCSTLLYVDDQDVAENIGVKGYRVARARVLFALPPELQRLRPDPTQPDAHLAYIELYTPFAEEPEEPSGLYAVSQSFVDGTRKTAVIPAGQIFRSCHLLPRSGAVIDRSWESATVLDQCNCFFLNTFSDHYMYLFVE